MKTLIVGAEQHEKTGVICTGVVALASSAARIINYHLASVLCANMAI